MSYKDDWEREIERKSKEDRKYAEQQRKSSEVIEEVHPCRYCRRTTNKDGTPWTTHGRAIHEAKHCPERPNMKRKACDICGKELPITAEYFHRDKYRKDGFHRICKKCNSEKQKRVYREKKETEIRIKPKTVETGELIKDNGKSIPDVMSDFGIQSISIEKLRELKKKGYEL